ncbi:MAG TPA: alpha-amylase, partial [Verrucomicrobiae bacterium]|nr:alpha-amylase [Verrucomicrobiae bacterium]
GKDFVIIDFEGEPSRPLSERRLKRSPLRDVAGMIRSFHYACRFDLRQQEGGLTPEDYAYLEPWGEVWYRTCAAVYLASYLATVGEASFIPRERSDMAILLEAFLLDKSVYEVGYELANRPDWLPIPIRGILDLLEGETPDPEGA